MIKAKAVTYVRKCLRCWFMIATLSPTQNAAFCAEGAASANNVATWRRGGRLAAQAHATSSSACSPSTTRLKRRIRQKQLEKASNMFLSAVFKVEVGTTDVQ
jgi:hypothetical protein